MINRREALLGTAATLISARSWAQSTARVTILYDAFGAPSDLKRGWGYSAFFEYGGHRVLFDTGAKVKDFAFNVARLGVDLRSLDFALVTHRHTDHTAGLSHVLSQNPTIPIYEPIEGAQFNSPMPPALSNLIKRQIDSVPQDLRYFDGHPTDDYRPESSWPGANFKTVSQPVEALPGIFVFSNRSEVSGTREMNEISMLIKTPKGGVLAVGCAHPGIENILEAATKIEPSIYTVVGGFHLVDMPDDKVTEMVIRFRDKGKIQRMAAGHCTGQFAFAEMGRIYGDRFDHAGVGSVLALPT